jgi:hypothetical protein
MISNCGECRRTVARLQGGLEVCVEYNLSSTQLTLALTVMGFATAPLGFLTPRVALDVGLGEGIEGSCVGGCEAVGMAAALQKGGHGVGRRVLCTLSS